jgi:hypothetical protein
MKFQRGLSGNLARTSSPAPAQNRFCPSASGSDCLAHLQVVIVCEFFIRSTDLFGVVFMLFGTFTRSMKKLYFSIVQ